MSRTRRNFPKLHRYKPEFVARAKRGLISVDKARVDPSGHVDWDPIWTPKAKRESKKNAHRVARKSGAKECKHD